jgi:hypothetical protein
MAHALDSRHWRLMRCKLLGFATQSQFQEAIFALWRY